MSESLHIPLGIVVERRKAQSKWIDYVWRPVTALVGLPDAEPWTMLKQDDESSVIFYAGAVPLELFATETAFYRDNLATGKPLLWVVLRPSQGAAPYELFKVTADPYEGEALTEIGTDLIETVAMPETIVVQIADFIARYHVERPFVKRKRNRANREVFGRRIPAREDKP